MSCASLKPTVTEPSTTPIHAGTTSLARIAALIRSMHSRLRGVGRPWPITLVSRADDAATVRLCRERPPRSRRRRRSPPALLRPGLRAGRDEGSGVTRTLERNFRIDRRARARRATPRRTRRPAPVASTSTTGSAAHLHERTLERHRRPLLAELHACDPVALTEGSGGCRARHTRQDLGLSLVGQERRSHRLPSSPPGTARAERLDERP